MSNDGMGNLEKLGILVIVILVVVVGVVAITPTDTLFPGMGSDEKEIADLPEPLPLPPAPAPAPGPDGENLGGQRHLDPQPLPPWPEPEPAPEPEPGPDPIKLGAQGQGGQQLRPEPAPEPLPEPAPAPAPAPEPGFRKVTVQKGDSLWLIAERELGSGSKHRLIQAANPGLNPNRLTPGQVVLIPEGTAAPRSEERRESASSDAGERHYVVQAGDTLMGLAQKFYGSTRHYRFLMDANGLNDPNQLRRDMELRVPPLPTSSANVAPEDRRGTDARGTAAPAAGARLYEVRKGDVPARIAREQLGDEGRWRELLELNGITDPRSLQPGMMLTLPR